MRQLLTMLFVFCLSNGQSQTYTVDNIKQEYSTIFTARVNHDEGETYVTIDINNLPNNNFLADFVNNNRQYINYILLNYSTIDRKKLDSLKTDTLKLNFYFINFLQVDNIFNKYFLDETYYYLTSVGGKIIDYQVPNKLKLTPDSLIKIATRFFYASNLKDNGNAQWNICVNNNGCIYNKKENMIPLIEAFCFITIMEDLKTNEYKVFSDFKKNIKKLNKQKLDINGDKKLNYYRQTMYQLMERSENLRNLLIDKYNKKREILNFELI